MKNYLTMMLCLFAFTANAGQIATTDKGEIVILNNDGTWSYQNAEAQKQVEIKTNKTTFNKPAGATFFLKSTRNKSAFWVDPKKWLFKKASDKSPSEYEFELKGMDLYGLAVTEGIEVSLEALAQVAVENARDSAPDAQVVAQEYRMVNGIKVLYQQMNGTTKGMKLSWIGYYFSDKSGSTQFLTYTSTNLVEKYKAEIESFLNGFTVQP